jgi:hypothetical protein
MSKLTVSKICREDILSGNSKYFKDSYLIFNGMNISHKSDHVIIEFLHDDILLATIEPLGHYTMEDTLYFKLNGKMKIEIS